MYDGIPGIQDRPSPPLCFDSRLEEHVLFSCFMNMEIRRISIGASPVVKDTTAHTHSPRLMRQDLVTLRFPHIDLDPFEC